MYELHALTKTTTHKDIKTCIKTDEQSQMYAVLAGMVFLSIARKNRKSTTTKISIKKSINCNYGNTKQRDLKS